MSGMPECWNALLLAAFSSLPEEAFSGRVEGGWGYIGFCYALAWASLLAYALYLFFLRKQLQALPPEALPPKDVPPPNVPPERGPKPSSPPTL